MERDHSTISETNDFLLLPKLLAHVICTFFIAKPKMYLDKRNTARSYYLNNLYRVLTFLLTISMLFS